MSETTPPAAEAPLTPLDPLEETEADQPDRDEPTLTRLDPPVDLADPADSTIGDMGIAAVPGAPPSSVGLGAPTLPPRLPLTPSRKSGRLDEDGAR